MPCAKWRMATTSARHDGNQQAPGQVGDAQRLVRRERRDREIRLMQSVPVRNPGEHERSGSRGHESRKQRAADLLRGDLPAGGRHLEEEKCRDQRSPEERGDRRKKHLREPGAALPFPPCESA